MGKCARVGFAVLVVVACILQHAAGDQVLAPNVDAAMQAGGNAAEEAGAFVTKVDKTLGKQDVKHDEKEAPPSGPPNNGHLRVFRCQNMEATEEPLQHALWAQFDQHQDKIFKLGVLKAGTWESSGWEKVKSWFGKDDHQTRVYACDPGLWKSDDETATGLANEGKLTDDKLNYIYVSKPKKVVGAGEATVWAFPEFTIQSSSSDPPGQRVQMWPGFEKEDVYMAGVLQFDDNWFTFVAPGRADFYTETTSTTPEGQEKVSHYYNMQSKFRCMEGFNPYAMKKMLADMRAALVKQKLKGKELQNLSEGEKAKTAAEEKKRRERVCSPLWLGEQQALLSNYALRRESCGLEADFKNLEDQYKAASEAKKKVLFACLRFAAKLTTFIPGVGDIMGLVDEGIKMLDSVAESAMSVADFATEEVAKSIQDVSLYTGAKHIFDSGDNMIKSIEENWLVKEAQDIKKKNDDADEKQGQIQTFQLKNIVVPQVVKDTRDFGERYMALAFASTLQELLQDTYHDCYVKNPQDLEEQKKRIREQLQAEEAAKRREIEQEMKEEYEKMFKQYEASHAAIKEKKEKENKLAQEILQEREKKAEELFKEFGTSLSDDMSYIRRCLDLFSEIGEKHHFDTDIHIETGVRSKDCFTRAKEILKQTEDLPKQEMQ